MSRLAIVAALPHEIQLLLPQFSQESITQFKDLKILSGRLSQTPCLLVLTGMGPKRAAIAGSYLAKNFTVSRLISTGYAGALNSQLKTGTAILAQSLSSDLNQSSEIYSDIEALQSSMDILTKSEIPYSPGKMCSVQMPLLSSEDKKNLALSSQADAVDMESFYFLKAFQENQKSPTPLAAIRFIFDEAEEDLSVTQNFTNDQGQVLPFALAGQMLKKPKLLFQLLGWQRKVNLAQKRMTEFVRQWIKRA